MCTVALLVRLRSRMCLRLSSCVCVRMYVLALPLCASVTLRNAIFQESSGVFADHCQPLTKHYLLRVIASVAAAAAGAAAAEAAAAAASAAVPAATAELVMEVTVTARRQRQLCESATPR